MTGIKSEQSVLLIALVTFGLLPTLGFAASKPITTRDLFKTLSPTEPWHRGVLTATKTVNFQQATNTSGGTDATTVAKVQLGYFTSADCTGAKSGSGFYTTPNGTSFTISVGTAFGLVAASTWSVGANQLLIGDMTGIQSIAVTLKSTNSNVPQADFSSNSFACVAVTCATGTPNACTSAAGTQSFELKTTAAVGDPADGGVIACSTAAGNTFDLLAPASDSSGAVWGNKVLANAASQTDGSANTAAIIATQTASSYAAKTCDDLVATGGVHIQLFFTGY